MVLLSSTEIKVADLTSLLTIKVTGLGKLKFRMAVARYLFTLGARIAGTKLEIGIKSDD